MTRPTGGSSTSSRVVKSAANRSTSPPTTLRSGVNGVPCVVHDRSGIILAFGWGTAYAMRLPPPEFAEALRAEASAAQKWSGGSVTDLSVELGPDWLFGKWGGAEEPGWVAAAYRAFDRE
jgi:hypothetical protein